MNIQNADIESEYLFIGDSRKKYNGKEKPTAHITSSFGSFIDMKATTLSSTPQILMNTFKSFVGSGILALPFGFSRAGWAESLIIFMLLFLIAYYCMMNLVDCKLKCGSARIQTYADVGKEAFSIIGMWIVNVSQIASQLLYCCSYMMIMTENLEYIVPSVRQEIWVMALVAIFYLTSFFRSMRVLSMISVTANLALVIAVVLVFSSLLITGDRKTAEIVSFQGSGAPLMIGITLFSFEGIGLVIPMQGSMAQPQHYGKSLTFVLFLVFILDFLFGTICYASLGTSTPELISRAVSSEYPTLKTLSILLIISSLGASYDLLLIPVFTTIDESSHLRSMRRRHKKATRIASSLLDLTVICVSVLPSLTPIRTHFPAFISFIGATVGCWNVLILPSLLHLKLTWRRNSIVRRIVDFLLILFGGILLIGTTVLLCINLHKTII